MRAFVALAVPDDVGEELQRRLADVVGDQPDLHWVPAQRWHVTLAFLGEVSDDTVADLTPRLERAARRNPPLRLRLEGAGRFGDRVLWLGVGGDREPLRRLAASVSAAAERVGIEREHGRYRPHLTVARTRQRFDLQPVVTQLGDVVGAWWTAAEVTMFCSTIGPSVEHTAVAAWPLLGPTTLDA